LLVVAEAIDAQLNNHSDNKYFGLGTKALVLRHVMGASKEL
jgi:hypothetical protein